MSSKKFDGDVFTDQDFTTGTQVVQRQNTAPSNPVNQQLWYDTTVDRLKQYDGSQWVIITGAGGKFGDGSDGSYTSGNNLTPGVEYNFTDFTLNSGDILSSTQATSEEPIVIRVLGDVTIDGTIDLSGQGLDGGNDIRHAYPRNDPASNLGGMSKKDWNYIWTIRNQNNEYVAFMGKRAGGGFPPTLNGDSDNWYEVTDKGYRPGYEQRNINNFTRPDSLFALRKYNIDSSIKHIVPGAGGGGGEGSGEFERAGDGAGGGASRVANGFDGSSSGFSLSSATSTAELDGGKGGNGGGSILIVCRGNLNINGTIDLSGANGANGADGSSSDQPSAGGGGGGAGGQGWLLYKGSLTDNSTKVVSGGAGGLGGTTPDTGSAGNGGDGGDGGNGEIIIEQV